jgi:glucosamine--fructose-6-phosphate aminotransferase (isomerizing)
MTFAASLVVLAALARVLAEEPVEKVLDEITDHAEVAATAMERLLGDASLPDRLAAWLGERGTIVILGRGPARAAAEMGALTIKEAVGIPVESLETAQFRHGPLELAGPDLAAIVIATEPETIALDLGLAEELLASGAAVLLVTQGPVSPTGATRPRMQPGTYPGMQPGMYVELGEVNRALAPAVSILPAQLLAWRLASLRGREPGSYYRASKVTTRE